MGWDMPTKGVLQAKAEMLRMLEGYDAKKRDSQKKIRVLCYSHTRVSNKNLLLSTTFLQKVLVCWSGTGFLPLHSRNKSLKYHFGLFVLQNHDAISTLCSALPTLCINLYPPCQKKKNPNQTLSISIHWCLQTLKVKNPLWHYFYIPVTDWLALLEIFILERIIKFFTEKDNEDQITKKTKDYIDVSGWIFYIFCFFPLQKSLM